MSQRDDMEARETQGQAIYETLNKGVVVFFAVAQGLIVIGIVAIVSMTVANSRAQAVLDQRYIDAERRIGKLEVKDESQDGRLNMLERGLPGR